MLGEKGYGEEEAKKRSRAALERMKKIKEMEERRRKAAAPPGGTEAAAPATGTVRAAEGEPGRRAVDWAPVVPQWLRRRINRYAYKNGFLITRLPQRFEDFMSHFDQSRPESREPADSGAAGRRKGFSRPEPLPIVVHRQPRCAARDGSAVPGSAGNRRTVAPGRRDPGALRAREPFAVEFFSASSSPTTCSARASNTWGPASARTVPCAFPTSRAS